jgi:hypothetical protein
MCGLWSATPSVATAWRVKSRLDQTRRWLSRRAPPFLPEASGSDRVITKAAAGRESSSKRDEGAANRVDVVIKPAEVGVLVPLRAATLRLSGREFEASASLASPFVTAGHFVRGPCQPSPDRRAQRRSYLSSARTRS